MAAPVGVSVPFPPDGEHRLPGSAEGDGPEDAVPHTRPAAAGDAPAGTAGADQRCQAGPGRARRPGTLFVRAPATR